MPTTPTSAPAGRDPALHAELQRHLLVLVARAENETDPLTRAAWDDQAEAVRALLGLDRA